MSFQLDYDLRKPNDLDTNRHWLTLFSQDKLACSKCGKIPACFYSQLHHVAACKNAACREEMAEFINENPEEWPEEVPPNE